MSLAVPAQPGQEATPCLTAQQDAFIRAELIRRLFEGAARSRYSSFVLWPVIAAIYWRQVDLLDLLPMIVAHVAVTLGFDRLRRDFTRAAPDDGATIHWGGWFTGLSFLAGTCWGVTGYMLAVRDFELQRMLLSLVLLAAITTAVPIRSAHPPAFRAFAGATAAPLVLALLTAADPFFQLVGIAGGAYVAHLMTYVRDVHRWQYDNLALACQKEQLARAAEDANRAKSSFLATMSHEIRTPMTGVLGMIDMLDRTALSAGQREALDGIRCSASGLLRVVDDVLDVSRIEAGRLDLEHIELRPAALVEAAARTFAPQAAAKGLDLSTRIGAAVPERAIGDPLRLQQILLNLLGNAIKFTERGSVLLSLDSDGGPHLRIEVADTGPGLTAAQQARLFQPFVQADSSTPRRFGGSGLGLSIVRRLAEAMGGSVDVRSAPGTGSTFIVEVRLDGAEATPSCSEAATPATVPLRVARRVLVVDDNAVNRRVLARQLALAGAAADVAQSGEEALALWRTGAYDVVLADLQMPGMDGFELARRLRQAEQAERRPRTPILALTASAPAEEEQRSRAAGMDGFVAKPTDVDRLAAVLAPWLGSARP